MNALSVVPPLTSSVNSKPDQSCQHRDEALHGMRQSGIFRNREGQHQGQCAPQASPSDRELRRALLIGWASRARLTIIGRRRNEHGETRGRTPRR